MASVTNITNTVQPNLSGVSFKNLNRTGFKPLITEGAPSLGRPLVHLVTQYLFPESQGWIAEWSGPHGYDVICDAVTNAETPLRYYEASLVVEYLKKKDIFGLVELEKAAGGKEELQKLMFGERTFLPKSLFGEKTYNPQLPLPLEIDDVMQAPLSQYFDAETLRGFQRFRTLTRKIEGVNGLPNISKMTELYSLYWLPKDMTLNISEGLAKKHGTGIAKEDSSKELLQSLGNKPTTVDYWIAFPNDVFGREKICEKQGDLIPKGFDLFPHVLDVAFCVFMKYACTKEYIMSSNPCTYTRCRPPLKSSYREAVDIDVEFRRRPRCDFVVGGFGNDHGPGFCEFGPNNIDQRVGVAVTLKFYK